jgi:hypothetical protein
MQEANQSMNNTKNSKWKRKLLTKKEKKKEELSGRKADTNTRKLN